jgi:hypothetical protein
MLNHRHRNKKIEREKESARYMFVALGRKKREKEKKNERNMRSRFDNQLEAAAFKIRCNTSPNEREILFAIQLVQRTIE